MSTRAAAIVVMAVFMMSVVGLYPPAASAAKMEEKPPVATDLVMTQAQLRYCYFQKARMEAASEAANNTSKHEIDALNALGGDWNARCSRFRYAEPDMAAVEADVAAARKRLKAEGRALVDGWREKRKASLNHVIASIIKLRSGPGTGYGVVAKLKKYQEVYITGNAVNGWLPVAARNNNGYVEATVVKPGSGKQARRAYCQPIAGKPPANGEIIQGKTNGKNIIEIDNGRDHDGYVKLKGRLGRTNLAVFVKRGTKVKVKDVPDGSYLIMFATGVEFSRGCGNFMDIRDVMAFDDRSVFKSKTDANATRWTEIAVTLQPMKDGNAIMREIDLADFEAD